MKRITEPLSEERLGRLLSQRAQGALPPDLLTEALSRVHAARPRRSPWSVLATALSAGALVIAAVVIIGLALLNQFPQNQQRGAALDSPSDQQLESPRSTNPSATPTVSSVASPQTTPSATLIPTPQDCTGATKHYSGGYVSRLKADPRFGTIYDEPQADGSTIVVVGVTADPDAVYAEICGLAPARTTFQMHLVDYSWNDLQAVKGAAEALMTKPTPDNVKITFVSVDGYTDRVVVGIDPYTDAAAAALSESLGPEAVVVAKPPAKYM